MTKHMGRKELLSDTVIMNDSMNSMILILTFLFVSSGVDNLMWNISSNPVVFGDTAELSCYIPDVKNACSKKLSQWIGGQRYSSLCQNMKCSDDGKYLAKRKTPCSYTLIINNFSMYDVNCDYACYYGTESYRKLLQLNSKEFVSKPVVRYKNVSTTGDVIAIHAFIEDVYPSPECYVIFLGKNITSFLQVKTKKNEFFYDVQLEVNHPISGSGNVTIACHSGNQIFEVLNQYVDGSKDLTENGESKTYAWIAVFPIIVVLAMCVFLVLKSLKKSKEAFYILLKSV